MAEENQNNAQAAEEAPKKKGLFSESAIEVWVAVFLGITALLTAWASWIGSLHGGNQSTNYTESNNLATEGNAMYNEAMQTYLSDLMVWNTLMEYSFDQDLAELRGDQDEVDLIEDKIDSYINDNGSEILVSASDRMTEGMNSPFDVPGVIDEYFADAEAKLQEAQDKLDQGKEDNSNGDRYNLVTVIYSVVLFLLGIVGVFKQLPCRAAVLIIAVAGTIFTTVFMCLLPMPTGFSLSSFFNL